MPVIVPRNQHSISRSAISPAALKVLYALRKAGYEAYLVGGGIRDLLLKAHPKDFDIATNAHPEQVRTLFRNCRLVGRRFRLAHIYFGGHFVEVATFRGQESVDSMCRMHSKDGMILRDNSYGTLEDDVFRRDFTINALYYSIRDFSVVDYVGGFKDLQLRCVRVIGDPKRRFREDPLRILRAIRFAAKLNFHIEQEAATTIRELGYWVQQVHPSRLLDEYIKLFLSGFALKSFSLLKQYGLFEILFPTVAVCLAGDTNDFLEGALRDTDTRVQENLPVSLSFLFAAFLWIPLMHRPDHFLEAIDSVLAAYQHHIALPKRLKQGIVDIWYLQMRLIKKHKKRVVKLRMHPKFRAGVDFLVLRAAYSTDPNLKERAVFWQQYIREKAEETYESIQNH